MLYWIKPPPAMPYHIWTPIWVPIDPFPNQLPTNVSGKTENDPSAWALALIQGT